MDLPDSETTSEPDSESHPTRKPRAKPASKGKGKACGAQASAPGGDLFELRDGVLHLGSPAVQPAALAVVTEGMLHREWVRSTRRVSLDELDLRELDEILELLRPHYRV